MARTGFQSVDDYIAAQPAQVRPALERVRATILEALPGAIEGISYQIPVYRVDGVMVLYFAGYRRHYSIYPATARVLDALGSEARGLLHAKATLRFPLAGAVPTRLIARVARLRAAEVAGLERPKAASRAPSRKARPGALARRRARTGRARSR
jgi:uncharacterized protein YdhG (YjbR/CyaY superfamily)